MGSYSWPRTLEYRLVPNLCRRLGPPNVLGEPEGSSPAPTRSKSPISSKNKVPPVSFLESPDALIDAGGDSLFDAEQPV